MGYDYEYDRQDVEVPSLRERVDTEEARRPPEGLSELQADEVGHASLGREEGGGYVYFIETEDGQFVKIGYSVNPPSRVNEHRAFAAVAFGSAIRVIGIMPGTPRTEQWLHVQFRAHRARNEWYLAKPILQALGGLKLIAPPNSSRSLTVKEMAGMGGNARAASLTAKRRKEIARNAAAARWKGRKVPAKAKA